MYNDYLAGTAEYERNYQNAKEMYEYYLEMRQADESKEVSDYDISTAKSKMESAKEAIETYKNGKTIEYSQTLAELEKSFTNSKEQQHFKSLSDTIIPENRAVSMES